MKRAIVKSMTENTAWHSHCQFITFITFLFTVNVIRQMAPLFSKVDSNKLLHDVQNEENVICAKFGKDLFNISKVIGGGAKWPLFFGLPGTFRTITCVDDRQTDRQTTDRRKSVEQHCSISANRTTTTIGRKRL